jgi:hypothetical protein
MVSDHGQLTAGNLMGCSLCCSCTLSRTSVPLPPWIPSTKPGLLGSDGSLILEPHLPALVEASARSTRILLRLDCRTTELPDSNFPREIYKHARVIGRMIWYWYLYTKVTIAHWLDILKAIVDLVSGRLSCFSMYLVAHVEKYEYTLYLRQDTLSPSCSILWRVFRRLLLSHRDSYEHPVPHAQMVQHVVEAYSGYIYFSFKWDRHINIGVFWNLTLSVGGCVRIILTYQEFMV